MINKAWRGPIIGLWLWTNWGMLLRWYSYLYM
jgi:hypothetical protein